jgi:DNA-binding PadR family transcriptional regulator
MTSIEPRPPGPLSMAVLALLHEEPMHPYQISFTMRERHWDWCIKLKFGSLYHTVETLIRAGLIEPVDTEREGRRPERTIYALTSLGREEFLARLGDMVRTPEREYTDFAAGLKFIGHLDRETAARLLRHRLAALQLEVDHVDAVIQMLGDVKRLRRLSRIELEHAQALYRAEIGWIGGLAHEIESGELEWKPGCLDPADLKEARA